MRSAESFLDLARTESLRELHDQLLPLAAATDAPPPALMPRLSARLRSLDVGSAGLPPRPLVALRLIAVESYDAAWLVLQDNAVGVVPERFRQSTSSGARRTSPRLPLTTRVEPPQVFAWLPGFRDPRHAAPDTAYDITHLASLRVLLEEMWWDGGTLVLAGTAWLRHLPASDADIVTITCTHTDGREHVAPARRRRRPDHVRGTGGDLTRLAWSGWEARLDRGAMPSPGVWRLGLRLDEQGLVRELPLGASLGPAIPEQVDGRGGNIARIDERRRLIVSFRAPAHVRAVRRLLHPVAGPAPRR